MKTIIFDPSKGMARQGDVIIWKLPAGFIPSTAQKIAARDGRLILVEGEATGHHHSILERVFNPPRFRDDAMAHAKGAEFVPTVGVASLYRDNAMTQKLAQDYLTTTALCVGYLHVEHAPISLEHQEHDAIKIPVGWYYVGRQREFNAGDVRNVQD